MAENRAEAEGASDRAPLVGRQSALATLGFSEVKDARLGKIIELDLDAKDAAEARKRVEQMCEKLLANLVIEEYRVEEIR